MPTATATSGGNKPANFDDGRYILTLAKDVTDLDSQGQPLVGTFGPQWLWTFSVKNQASGEALTDERGFDWEYRTRTSQKMGKGGARTAQARLYIEALLGRDLELGEDVDTGDLVGTSFSAVLTENEKGYVDIVESSIKPYSRKKAVRKDEDDEPPF